MILLTGSNGFVGKALRQKLVFEGVDFTVAVRCHEQATCNQHITVGDIDGTTSWSQALSGVNAVIHLAARVHIMNDKSANPLLDFRQVNVEGTRNLALQAASAGVKRFIFLSSIKVNGESTQQDQKFQADDIPSPEGAYAVSKMEAEQCLFKIANETGMEIVIIRSPLVYGPGVKANFQTLINLVRKGIPLPLGAVTGNRRSLIGVDNLVDFIFTCATHPVAVNQIFLVSDDEDLSTSELLRRMYKAFGASDRLIVLPLWFLKFCATAIRKQTAYTRLCGSLQIDISKSKHLLGWKPPVSVDEGLRRALGRS